MNFLQFYSVGFFSFIFYEQIQKFKLKINMYLFLSSYIILKEKGKFLNVLNNHSCYFSGILINNLMIY